MSHYHNKILRIGAGENGESIARECVTDSGGIRVCYKIGYKDARRKAAEIAAEADAKIEKFRKALSDLVQEFPYPASEDEMDAYNKARQVLKGETHD